MTNKQTNKQTNKLRHFLRRGILIFGVALITVSCQKDDELKQVTTNTENKSGLIFKTLNKTEVVSNSLIKQKLNTLNKKPISNVANRDVYMEGYDFTISTDGVNYIETEDGAYHSYTFKIKRANSNGLLENLIFSLQPDGSYKTVLVNYQLTPGQVNKLEQHLPISLINNTISTTVLDDDNLTLNLLAKETLVADFEAGCLTLFEQICDCNQHTAETGYSACNCYRQVAWQHCMDDNSGGTSDDSTGDNNSDIGSGIITDGTTGGSQTPDTTNDYDPTDPSIHGDNNVLSNPNYEEPAAAETETPDEKNCEELQKLLETPTYPINAPKKSPKNAIIDLQGKLELWNEQGYTLSQNSALNSFANPVSNANSAELDYPTHPAIYGGMHTHPDNTNSSIKHQVIPMLSHGDIHGLFQFTTFYNNPNNPNPDPSLFVHILVSYQGTYAIKINDMIKFQAIQAIYADKKKKWRFESKLNRKLGRFYTLSTQQINGTETQYQKAFLEFVNNYDGNGTDLGISLYKVNTESDSWEKLEINEIGTDPIKETPCN